MLLAEGLDGYPGTTAAYGVAVTPRERMRIAMIPGPLTACAGASAHASPSCEPEHAVEFVWETVHRSDAGHVMSDPYMDASPDRLSARAAQHSRRFPIQAPVESWPGRHQLIAADAKRRPS